MEIKESGENYLETILNLEKKNKVVRSVDISKELSVSKPSVSRAMNVLKKAGYIQQETYSNIYLTEKGREKATEVYKRHVLITQFLEEVLKVPKPISENDACRIEHVISSETLEAMGRLIKKNDI